MIRLLIRFTETVNAFTAKMKAFTATIKQKDDPFTAQILKIQEEDAARPIEDMPFAERHARIVKYRKAYMVIAAVQLVLRAAQLAKIATLCAVAVGIGVAIARIVNVMGTP